MKTLLCILMLCTCLSEQSQAFTYTYHRQGYQVQVKSTFDLEDVKDFYRGIQLPIFIQIKQNDKLQQGYLAITGGKAIPHPKKAGYWMMTATSEQIIMRMGVVHGEANEQLLERRFRVQPIPHPQLYWEINGRRLADTCRKVSIPGYARVKLVIEPDADFRARFPREARYIAKGVRFFAQLSLGSPTASPPFQSSTPNEVSIPITVNAARGTQVFLKTGQLYRKNRNGWLQPVDNSQNLWPPPLVLTLR